MAHPLILSLIPHLPVRASCFIPATRSSMTLKAYIYAFFLLPSLLVVLVPAYGAVAHHFDDREGAVALRRFLLEEAAAVADSSSENGSIALAADRTNRRDPLHNYDRYEGGWNISDQHYWASVGFTAVPLFAFAVVWFHGFGLALIIISCCICCRKERSTSYSSAVHAISLAFLLLFTCTAVVGCGILYYGQGRFHGSTLDTIDYVVGQANLTVDNLRNFSRSLSAARNVGIGDIALPKDVRQRIDELQTKLNSSANELSNRTLDNSVKIATGIDNVGLVLVVIAAVMLALSVFGLLFSILGVQCLVSILVVLGWILVAGAFIVCGIFLLFHNVVSDTCLAMGEWVANPQAHTALDDILPCIDPATANESMYRSRDVTNQLVKLVNNVVVNVSNQNFPTFLKPLYFNQNGPLVPPLCSPYTPDLNNRTCAAGEVTFDDAPEVWKGYECEVVKVNGSEVCTTRGRITPTMYGQMMAAVSIGEGLYQYGPFLKELMDCSFVRVTFTSIDEHNCPGLGKYSRWIYLGLVVMAVSVMISLVLWMLHTRERRRRKNRDNFISR